ncbi:hypothetical protein ACA910_013860 [Epithemia clementina (nom. ined.)]
MMPANQPSIPTLPDVWKHTITVLLGIPEDAEGYIIISNWVIHQNLTLDLDDFYNLDISILEVGNSAMAYKKQLKGAEIILSSTLVLKLHGIWGNMHTFPEPNDDETVDELVEHMNKDTGKLTFLSYDK